MTFLIPFIFQNTLNFLFLSGTYIVYVREITSFLYSVTGMLRSLISGLVLGKVCCCICVLL